MSNKSIRKLRYGFFALLISMLACQQFSPLATVELTLAPQASQTAVIVVPTNTQPPQFTDTSVPTNTPEPTKTPEPVTLPASAASIEIGAYKFRIARVVYEGTLMGMQPSDMSSSDQVMCVELELLSGDPEAFASLPIQVLGAEGSSTDAVALMSAGRVNLLSSMTMTGESAVYEPDSKNIAWAFVVPKGTGKLYLVFPSGERVDLSLLPRAADTPVSAPVTATSSPPVSQPVAGTPLPPVAGLPTSTIAPEKGEERIRVENNSGKDFSIKMACTGGPCLEFTKNSYNYKFPDGLHYFYVHPGRYKITWTICGKTEGFEHVLNGQWYIHLKKCK